MLCFVIILALIVGVFCALDASEQGSNVEAWMYVALTAVVVGCLLYGASNDKSITGVTVEKERLNQT